MWDRLSSLITESITCLSADVITFSGSWERSIFSIRFPSISSINEITSSGVISMLSDTKSSCSENAITSPENGVSIAETEYCPAP